MKGMKQKGEEGRGTEGGRRGGKKREAARWVPLPPSPPLLAEGERERNVVAHPRVEIEREQAAPLPPRVAVANARAVADHPGTASEAEPRPKQRVRAIATDGEGGARTEKVKQPPSPAPPARVAAVAPSPRHRPHHRATGAPVADAGDRWLPKNTTVVAAEEGRSRALFWPLELPAEPQLLGTPLPPPSSTADRRCILGLTAGLPPNRFGDRRCLGSTVPASLRVVETVAKVAWS
ncbi:uncharacterized protein DS421_1g12660 [Arachis hypogaea]|nr:uncharacterized protein DS421_1g12660 [Arachis hypogaea]